MVHPPVFAKVKARPSFIVPVAAMFLCTFGAGPNLFLVILSSISLIVVFYLLWRPGELQVLLFLIIYQWMQVSSSIFFANLRGVSVSELILGYPSMDKAALLVFFALIIMSVGMRLGIGPQSLVNEARMRSTIASVPAASWLHLHMLFCVLSVTSRILADNIPVLSQPFLALANFKWATFVALTIVTFSNKKTSKILWFLIFSIEFLSAVGGFFSSFKFVFIYTLVAITAISRRITVAQIISSIFIISILLVLSLYWTSIKPEFRKFLNNGEKSQVVLVSPLEAFDVLIDLIVEVNVDDLSRSSYALLNRFSELDMFSAVIDHVPSVEPHVWGSLWGESILRPFMPRIFFPEKAIIDESELSRQFTGMEMAGFSEGTQISMGYIAESYIDFSELFMWFPLYIFGFFIGRMHRWFIDNPNGLGVIGFSFSCSIFLQIGSIGFSSSKLFGGILVSLIIAYLLLCFAAPYYIRYYNIKLFKRGSEL
jgi:hypothetical protein